MLNMDGWSRFGQFCFRYDECEMPRSHPRNLPERVGSSVLEFRRGSRLKTQIEKSLVSVMPRYNKLTQEVCAEGEENPGRGTENTTFRGEEKEKEPVRKGDLQWAGGRPEAGLVHSAKYG